MKNLYQKRKKKLKNLYPFCKKTLKKLHQKRKKTSKKLDQSTLMEMSTCNSGEDDNSLKMKNKTPKVLNIEDQSIIEANMEDTTESITRDIATFSFGSSL